LDLQLLKKNNASEWLLKITQERLDALPKKQQSLKSTSQYLATLTAKEEEIKLHLTTRQELNKVKNERQREHAQKAQEQYQAGLDSAEAEEAMLAEQLETITLAREELRAKLAAKETSAPVEPPAVPATPQEAVAHLQQVQACLAPEAQEVLNLLLRMIAPGSQAAPPPQLFAGPGSAPCSPLVIPPSPSPACVEPSSHAAGSGVQESGQTDELVKRDSKRLASTLAVGDLQDANVGNPSQGDQWEG
jgi:hypothetical protein